MCNKTSYLVDHNLGQLLFTQTLAEQVGHLQARSSENGLEAATSGSEVSCADLPADRPEEEAAPLGVGEKLDVEAGKRRKDVGVGIGDVIVDNEGRQKCRRRRKRR